MDALVEAIRRYQEKTHKWDGYDDIGRDFAKFIERLPGEKRSISADAALDIMRGKRDNLKDDQRRQVHRFLHARGLNVELDDQGKIQVTSLSRRQMDHYSGHYLLLHDIQPDNFGDIQYLSCRDLFVDVRDGVIHGRTNTREDGMNQSGHRGSVKITPGVDNSDIMLMVCEDEGRREPPVAFMLNFVNSGDVGIFYGIGIGLRYKNTRVVAAAKVVGLPVEWFPDFYEKLHRNTVGDEVFELIQAAISGRSEYDSDRSMFFGFDYFDKARVPKQILDQAFLVKKKLEEYQARAN